MALADIFDKIATILQTQNFGDLNGTPRTYPTLTSFNRAQDVFLDGVPPRVNWVPTSGTFVAPVGQGGDGINTPRPIYTNRNVVVVDLWAADLDSTNNERSPGANQTAAENLLNDFCVSMQLQCTGSWWPKSVEWLNVDGEMLIFGVVARMTIEINTPIVNPTAKVVSVTAIPATVGLPNNSVLVNIT